MSERFGKGHDNIDDAAAAALFLLSKQPRVAHQEYMGLLVQGEDGKYYRTGLQTQGNRDASEWIGRPGGKVVGVVHNHPGRRARDVYPSTSFSPTDIHTAQELGVPSYITAIGAPNPDRRLPNDEGTRRATTPVQGEEFLAEFPWEELKAYMMRTLLDRAPNDPRGLTK